jgi:predicted RNA-binding protein with PIN domain
MTAHAYWLDGYNLIMRKNGGRLKRPLEDERSHFLTWLGSYPHRIHVFFDASRAKAVLPPDLRVPSRITTIFVTHGSADDFIVERLRNENAASITVVTDDRELRIRVHQMGARSLGVGKFLKDVETAHLPSPPPQKSPAAGDSKIKDVLGKLPLDTDYWMKELGLDPNWKPDDDDLR